MAVILSYGIKKISMEDEQLKDAEEVLDQTEQPVEEPSPSAEELLALERDKFLRLFAEF